MPSKLAWGSGAGGRTRKTTKSTGETSYIIVSALLLAEPVPVARQSSHEVHSLSKYNKQWYTDASRPSCAPLLAFAGFG